MYSVLIVDDEEWVVESLRNGTAWEDFGFTVVDVAYDGAEALDKVRALKPDLVFTDIRMPEMGGLDFIRQVRRDELPVEFVVVSGYAEFAYAQKALRYGVMGFCLKPAEDAEVNAVLDHVRRILDSRHSVDVDTAEAMIGVAEGRYDNEFVDRLIRDGIILDNQNPGHIFARRGRSDVLKLSVKPSFTGLIGLNYRIWVLGDNNYLSVRDAVSEIAVRKNTVMGKSLTFTDINQIDRAVQEAIIACNQRYMVDCAGLYEYPDKPNTAKLRAELGHLGQAIADSDRTAMDRGFSAISELLKSGFTVKHASFVYNAIHFMISAGGFDDPEPVYHFEELLGIFSDVNFMLEYLKDTVAAYTHPDSSGNNSQLPSTVEKAIEYVDCNLFENISLKSLSERFYVSPSHLCRLFKKATGRPLTHYITGKRIECACNLLSETKLPVSEIAEKSGYENYFYFARVFKRVTGMTPTEHRATSS